MGQKCRRSIGVEGCHLSIIQLPCSRMLKGERDSETQSEEQESERRDSAKRGKRERG